MSSGRSIGGNTERPRNAVIRTAFAVEAIGNILGAIPMLLYPSTILTLVAPPASFAFSIDTAKTHPASVLATSPSPQAVTLLRWLGALTLGLTPQLLLGLSESPQAVASRRMVYVTLGAGEVALVCTMLWQAIAGNEAAVGITNRALIGSASSLGVICAWRVLVLVYKPGWFGDAKVLATAGKDRRPSKAEGKDT